MVEDLHEANKKINAVLEKISEEEFFRVFRVNLLREWLFWGRSSKCRLNSCPIEETQKLGNSTHVKTYKYNSDILVDKNLTKAEVEFTKHISLKEYSEKHNGETWTFDEHLDEDGIFVDLTKNPERYSGYNGSSIWHEIYEENLFKIQFPSKGAHEDLLYRIISGIQVNVNMHISKHYLENIDDVENVEEAKFYENYDIFYNRIGKFPHRIKNLFYTYMLVLHTLDNLKEVLPKYIYDTASKQNNYLVQNRMLWVGHYINSLIDPELIISDLFLNISRIDLKNIIKPKFENITSILDCIGWNICKLNSKVQFTGIGAVFKIIFPISGEVTLTENELSGLFNLAYRLSNTIKWYKEYTDSEERVMFYKTALFWVIFAFVILLLIIATVLWFYKSSKKEEDKPLTNNVQPSHL
jgi:ERO1-like protein beta